MRSHCCGGGRSPVWERGIFVISFYVVFFPFLFFFFFFFLLRHLRRLHQPAFYLRARLLVP